MEQYIPKSALVAKIEELDEFWHLSKNAGSQAFVESLFSFLNTLETKEVDLEKHLKEDIEDVLFDLNGVAVKGATHCLTVEDVKDIAKHFFELGIKAQKGE